MGAIFTAAFHKRCTACLVLIAGMYLGLPAPAIADKPPWPEASFTYVADRQPLAELLRNFARSFGLEVALSPMVSAIPDLVSGKFTTANPSEFMDQLGATYSLTWFT